MDSNILGILTGVAGLISSFIVGYLALRRAPSEIRREDSQASNEISEAAQRLLQPLNDRIAAQDKKIEALELELAAVKADRSAQLADRERQLETLRVEFDTKSSLQNDRIEELKTEISRFEDWANRLVAQVRALGGEPEELR